MNYYKCFYKGLINSYGMKFELGKEYQIIGKIKYGPNGNGYHVATRLEDTLRFFDMKKDNQLFMNGSVDIAIVDCRGAYDEIKDNLESRYSGDSDMYAFEYMTIKKILTREEIITYALNLNEERIKKFIMYFKLTNEEMIIFKEKYKNYINVLDYISYYQENDKEVFNRKYKIKKRGHK